VDDYALLVQSPKAIPTNVTLTYFFKHQRIHRVSLPIQKRIGGVYSLVSFKCNQISETSPGTGGTVHSRIIGIADYFVGLTVGNSFHL